MRYLINVMQCLFIKYIVNIYELSCFKFSNDENKEFKVFIS